MLWQRKKLTRKMLHIIIGILFLVYVIIPLMVLIFPSIVAFMVYANAFSSFNLRKPSEAGLRAAKQIDLRVDSGDTLGVWHILPESAADKPVIEDQFSSYLADGLPIFIYLHGKGGTRAQKTRVATYVVIQGQNCHIITFDYRGYADSTGEASEKNMVEDSVAVFYWVKAHSGSSPIFLWGHSLGSGIAVQVARCLSPYEESLAGVVLESSFNNLHEVLDHYRLTAPYRPFPLLMKIFHHALKRNDIQFSSDQHIIHVECPILMLHAEDDEIIPLSLARKLYSIAAETRSVNGSKVLLHEFPAKGYGHNFLHHAPDFGGVVRQFISEYDEVDEAGQT
ncbi:monoacylglycerol lipase ABHD12-like isoform X2 [Pomacea canaliculata]|uniref:monoacylglycerol lipase ABHD12-like isoform X2 n=1 Tax=Pomacea canaliculata TaxID=400727 RepID=UPI000D73A1D9|nr:monoacylglycerol lipase ABHD12-like isoform X2 [Pomacea canaliculata]